MGNYDCFVSSILQNSLFNSGFWGQLSNLMLRKLQKGGSKVGEEAAGARWLRNGKKLFWIFFPLFLCFVTVSTGSSNNNKRLTIK